LLKDKLKKYIEDNPHGGKLAIFAEERDYIEKNLLVDNLNGFEEKDSNARFEDAYLERCDKETENMLAQESSVFLNQPIDYLKKHKNEFVYIESIWFELISVEAVSIEADDVFGTYDVMLGLKLQKKHDKTIKEYLNNHLQSDEAKFDLLFSGEDGLWNLNFALNYIEGFNEEMTIGEAFQLIYRFLFILGETVEEKK
jgi:hypothetical protein